MSFKFNCLCILSLSEEKMFFWLLIAQYCGGNDGGIIAVGSELIFM
jgi:hypothetical protein